MRKYNEMNIGEEAALVFVRDENNEIVSAGLVKFRQTNEVEWDSEVRLVQGERFDEMVARADAAGFTVTGIEQDGYTCQIKGAPWLFVPFPVLCDVTVKLAREEADRMGGQQDDNGKTFKHQKLIKTWKETRKSRILRRRLAPSS